MKSYLWLILYLNMKTIGSPYSSKWTFYRHVFAHIRYVIQKSRVRTVILNGRSFRINSDKEINLVSNCSKIMRNIRSKAFAEKLFFVRPWRRKRPKMRVLRDFLWNAYDGLKRMQKNLRRFWAILNFTRALTRAPTRTRIFARIYWSEIDPTNMDLDHDKYEWEMAFCYEDMIISWFSQNGAQMIVTIILSHWKVTQF